MIERQRLLDAATKLHQHIREQHWTGEAVVGPDPGIRFNARIGRFIKGYLPFLPWKDNLIYAQAQKYWILNNWLMVDLGLPNSEDYRDTAIACADYLQRVQKPEGYWEYPNPEWRGRWATVEGNYASMGMLETYSRTKKTTLLQGAKKWYDFAVESIGFQEVNGELAINYFGNVAGPRVPNNAASALRIFGMLADAANDERYLEKCPGMIKFLTNVQLETGELPYAVPGPDSPTDERIHFLCHQYNAFQFLNIADYYGFTGDESVLPILDRLADFIATGVTETGGCRYDCNHKMPDVAYYGAAAGAALSRASSMGFGNYDQLSDRAYRRILSLQKNDGSIAFYSQNNYKLLKDVRSYPRYLSMILYHILLEAQKMDQLNPATIVQDSSFSVRNIPERVVV